jgi:hypothetical protein
VKTETLKYLTATIFETVALLLARWTAAEQESRPSSNELAAIAKSFPHTAIVTATDVSSMDCESSPSPGFLEADFNGDHHPDFAVLLKGSETGKVTNWEGKELREIRYVFAIFVNQGNGEFRVAASEHFVDYGQVGAYIGLQPARHVDSYVSKPITVSNPAVAVEWCGKSTVLYYFSHGRMKKFWTSD